MKNNFPVFVILFLIFQFYCCNWNLKEVEPLPLPDTWSCGDSILIDSRDLEVYETVLIGTQCWMKENLRYRPLEITDPSYTVTCDMCCDVCSFPEVYYKRKALDLEGGICPNGWRVPTDADWIELEKEIDRIIGDGTIIGDEELYWLGYSCSERRDITDERGINDELGVRIREDGVGDFSTRMVGFYDNGFSDANQSAFFWTSDRLSYPGYLAPGCINFLGFVKAGITRHVTKTGYGIRRVAMPETLGCCIRCIKNE